MSPKTSWKDVIAERQKESFVGRKDYIKQFTDNFASDIPNYLLFFVIGEGGVGKSTLLKQFESVGKDPEIDALVIICDDEQSSPVAAMGYIAEQLAKHDIKSKEFNEQYKTYRTRRDEIESDPKAPRGALNLVVRGMTDFAIKAARRAPGIGVFAEYVDEKEAGDALTQGVNYLVDRIGNKDEVQLLREPEKNLTPLFIELINEACNNARLVLMFDVFERTREALEPWLLEFLDFKFGEFDTGTTFVISGRDTVDQRWTQIASSICYITLEPFTLDETRSYLRFRKITNKQLVAQIFEDTGGLPVLVELLAGTNPKPGSSLPDISKDAVKRFLQWIPEEERRRVSLLAAVPRTFNLDILSATLGNNANNDFNWLSVQSYIRTSTTRGWFYHEKVRELMLRYLRNTSPNDLITANELLANFFKAEQIKMGLEIKETYDNEIWKILEIERVYHLVCEHPKNNVKDLINTFLESFRWKRGIAERIVEICRQASRETGSKELAKALEILTSFYQAYKNNEFENLISQAKLLSQYSNLSSVAESVLLNRRGEAFRHLEKNKEALMDFDHAISLDRNYAWAYANRGITHREMKNYELALSDLSCAIKLDENNASLVAIRGETYEAMNDHENAILDFDRAISINGKYDLAYANRGVSFFQMGKYDNALSDLNRAIELDKDYHWAYEKRGIVLRNLERYEEAIDSLTKAEETSATCANCLAERGITYQVMGQLNNALADFNRAIELEDKFASAILHRGIIYQALNNYEQALLDFNRVIELDEIHQWALAQRGFTYLRMGKLNLALTDFDYVLNLNLDNETAHFVHEQRGVALRRLNRHQEAIESLTEAEKLFDKCPVCIAERGVAYHLSKKYEQALRDLDRAIAFNENYTWAIAWRAETYRNTGRYQQALADFDLAIAQNEKYVWAISQRGLTYFQMEKPEQAIIDLTNAIAIDDKNTQPLTLRAQVYRHLGKNDEALLDFDLAVELDNKNEDIIAQRGYNYLSMGKYKEALKDFDSAILIDEKFHWAHEQRGIVLRNLKRHEESIVALTYAHELESTCFACVAERGETYRQFGQHQKALADYDQAIELGFAKDKGAWLQGITYRDMGNYEEAINKIDLAIELGEKNAPAFASRGEAYRRIGDFEKALSDFNHAIELDDKLDFAFAFRGELHRRSGNLELAIKDLSVAIELDPEQDIFARSRRAIAYHALGDIASRDSDISRVMEKESEVETNFYEKAVMSVLNGKHEQAIQFLKAAFKEYPADKLYAQNDDALNPLSNIPEYRETMSAG